MRIETPKKGENKMEVKSAYDIQREQAEKTAEACIIKAREVLKLLGFEEIKDREASTWNCWIVGRNNKGEGIFLNASESNKWRFNISGFFPRDKKGEYITLYINREDPRREKFNCDDIGQWHEPRISLDSNKTAEKIAKDIQTRLYPEYFARLEEARQKIADNNEYTDTTEKALTELKGKALTDDEKNGKEFSLYDIGKHGIVHASRELIRIEVSDLTIEQAKEILKIIKGE